MVANITEINNINSIDDAKNYSNYNGQSLTDAEKVIFDSPLLKKTKPDGTLEPDLDEVKGTVALLSTFKEAKDKLKSERENLTTNLTVNGNELLMALSEEKRKNSIAYQLVNTDENGEKRVDAMVAEYQDILFREVNPNLVAAINAKGKELVSIAGEGSKKDEEIAQKLTELTQKEKNELLDYQTKVNEIVDLIKADINNAISPSRRILDRAVADSKKTAYITYSTTTSYPDSLPSIIKTGIKGLYSNDPYTHPSYLTDDLPGQMMYFFKQFDRDKLFSLIDKKFTADEAKRVKDAFDRVINAKIRFDNFSDWSSDKMIQLLNNTQTEVDGKDDYEVSESIEQANEQNLFVSDIFCFMHALFPQNTPNLDFSNSDYLKAGDDNALPFTGTNNLNTGHETIWRGRADNLGGKKYKDTPGIGAYVIDPHYPPKKLDLSWAVKDGKSIPQFFWQVYDDVRAVQWDKKKYLSEDGVTEVEARPEDVSVYENMLRYAGHADSYSNDLLGFSYLKVVKSIIKNGGVSGGLDVEKYWNDWKPIFNKFFAEISNTYNYYREEAGGITYADLLANKQLLEEYYNPVENPVGTITTEMIDIWDEMKNIAQSKLDYFAQRNSTLGELVTEREKITQKQNEARDELDVLKASLNGIRTGGLANLKVQFERARTKTNKSWYDVLLMRQLLGLIYKLEEDTTEIAKFQGYETTLNTAERTRAGVLVYHDEWKGLPGTNFTEKLANWKQREGAGLTEEVIRGFFRNVKGSLENAQGFRGLSPEETTDLAEIKRYLDTNLEKTINDSDLKLALFIDCRVPTGLTEKWKNLSNNSSKDFRTNNLAIKAIADIINNLSDKDPFLAHLKSYVSTKTGLPAFPADDASERDKLEYFFKFKPEIVIEVIASWEAKDATKKVEIKNAMEAAKDPADNTKGLDLTVYGDGTNITEVGIIKFRGEELGGISHSFSSSQQSPHQHIPPTPQKWYEKFGYWPVWGSALLIGALTIAYFQRDSISEWWNGPAEEEGDNEEEQED